MPTPARSKAPKTSSPRFRRTGRWVVVGFFLLVAAATVAGNVWLPAKLEAFVLARLSNRNLTAEWKDMNWLPFHGLTVRGVVIRQDSGEKKLVCRTGKVTVRLPLWRAFDRDLRVTHWTVSGGDVTLGDADGEITLEKVDAEIETRLGRMIFHKVKARSGGLVADLKGELIQKKARPEPKPFMLKLKAVRSTLATLDFSPEGDPFRVTGRFEIDATGDEVVWKSTLNGIGRKVVWKDIALSHAEADAELSSGGSTIRAGVFKKDASASAVITKPDWKNTPFGIEGTLKDAEGRSDTFGGTVHKGTFAISRLAGPADLISIARGIPALAGGVPDGVEVTRFPRVDARDIRWSKEGGWKIGSAKLDGDGEALIRLNERTIGVRAISGTLSLDDRTWGIDDGKLGIFGGNVSVSGRYRGGALHRSVLDAEGLKLAEIKRAGGRPVRGETKGVLSLHYQGAADFPERKFDGTGTMRLDDAPVFEIPLLEEVYDLFAALVPGAKHSGDGRFDAAFTADGNVISVRHFEATGGSLSVNANGTVDLKQETVSGTARGSLGGPPGLLTRPIGRLLEMEVSGNFQKLDVKPVGPAKGLADAAEGTAGKVVESLEKIGEKLRGKDGSEKGGD